MAANRARWWLPATLSLGMLAAPLVARSQSAQSPVIQLMLSSPDARTRIQAAVTLGRLHPNGSRQALESALDDANPGVRAAAAQSLVTIGDTMALGALRAHSSDRDVLVRNGIARAIEALQQRQNAAIAATQPVPAMANRGSDPCDLANAQIVVRVGTLANHADSRGNIVDLMRTAILSEVGRSGGTVVAVAASQLPPEAEQRVRAGRARAYAIEGSVNSLRRWTVAQTLSVRAEVSLVLMTHPSRTIVGSLSGAATAQDRAPGYDPDGFARRLEERALSGAIHGALGRLQQSLLASR